MLRIDQLRLHPGQQETLLRARCAKLLRVAPADITACTVLRKAIDAREDLTLVYTVSVSVKNEAQVLRRCRDKRVSVYKQEVYFLPPPVTAPAVRPIVVGAGPAGLFAALVLARCGARPILLERGRPVEHRQVDVERFWSGGPLDPDSNVQFGEGGAGAFSDGKLNTGTKDLRHRFILETLVRCGAPDTILTDAKPHVGTDKLHIALQALRQELEAAGADIRFNARLEHIRIQDGAVSAVTVCQNGQTYDLPARHVLLALGHSARDTFEMLHRVGLTVYGAQALCHGCPHRAPPVGHRCRPVPFSGGPPGSAAQHLQAVLPPAQRPQRLQLLRLPRRPGGGRRLRAGAHRNQRHERLCP